MLLLLLLLAACGRSRGPLRPTFDSLQRQVFDVHCAVAGCHVGAAPESGLNLEAGQAHANLVGRPSTFVGDRQLVAPGRPDESYLIDKLLGRRVVGERMPLGREALPDSVVQVIRRWIERGAPE